MDSLPGVPKDQFLAEQLRAAVATTSAKFARVGQGGDGPSTRNAPKKVRPRHRMVVMLAEAGWKTKEIASALGYTESRVSIILGSDHPELQKTKAEFASRMADTIDDTYNRIKLYSNEMLDIMVGHARNTEEAANSRLAARDILHMAGYSPIKRQFNVNADVPAEELIKAAKTIEEANEVAINSAQWRVVDPASPQ